MINKLMVFQLLGLIFQVALKPIKILVISNYLMHICNPAQILQVLALAALAVAHSPPNKISMKRLLAPVVLTVALLPPTCKELHLMPIALVVAPLPALKYKQSDQLRLKRSRLLVFCPM